MNKEDIEWRFIWKECVDACQKTILADKSFETFFPALYKEYGDDKMITFEKAITFECLDNINEAIKLYQLSSDEKTGLPVSHWRKRALYYSERNTQNIVKYTDDFCTQWDVFYNLHTYVNLHPHIRYLAISSVSRVNNEPEMAVVIFRTCLEICLELYWSLSIGKNDRFLGEKINTVFSGKVDNKLEQALNTILDEGNLAAHPFKKNGFEKNVSQQRKDQPSKTSRTKEKPFEYKNKDITKILKAFDYVMKYCNSQAEKNGKGILCRDLQIFF